MHGEGVEGVLFKSCNSLEGLKGLGFDDLLTWPIFFYIL